MHIIIGFPVQQTSDLVLSRKSLEMMKLMLEDPLVQISAETDVECARETAHDIDAIISAISRHAVEIRPLSFCLL